MKRIFPLLFLFLAALAPCLVRAQHIDCGCTDHLSGEDSVHYARFWAGGEAARRVRAAAPGLRQGVVYNTGEVFQFRVAILITPIVLDEFMTEGELDKQKVYDFWDNAERTINAYYRNDVGIEIKVLRDDRLIMTENTTGFEIYSAGIPNASVGTKILDALLTNEAYDVGIMITKSAGGLAGKASLGGASSPYRKGDAFAMTNYTTIAHELGHLFGATHAHEIGDGDFTEPGKGQSIMSYGSPRDFFSVSSIRQMRNLLKNLNIYTNADRTEKDLTRNSDVAGTNIVYAYKETGTQPQLDADLIRQEYVVTLGSNFQFYLPLTNGEAYNDGEVMYCVHGHDLGSELSANALRSIVKPTASNNVMFHKRWANPATLTPGVPESQYAEPNSGDSRVGKFKFALAAHHHSLYDSRYCNIRIVPGEAFTATIQSPTNFNLFRPGRELQLAWTPQTDIYGENSRVRILLSDDFGQTFPYVLADDLPNTGTWTGVLPYMEIGKKPYYSYAEPVAGGIIKVEIIGEAVYGLTNNNAPFYYTGSSYTIGGGGFTLALTDVRYQFREKTTGAAAPTPFIRVSSREEVPAMPTLECYRNTSTYATTAKETEEGDIIRRTWTATISGTPYTYTQVIQLPSEKAADAGLVRQLCDASSELADLVRHEGEVGYPLLSLPAMQAVKQYYTDVYDADGFLRADYDGAAAAELLAALDVLHNLADDQIRYPEEGRYLLRSYQAPPAGTPYYYYAREDGEEGAESWTTDNGASVVLTLTRSGDYYTLQDDQGRMPYLGGLTNTYRDCRLEPGYTWGSFTLLSHIRWAAQLSRSGSTFSLNNYYPDNPSSYRCNNNDNVIVSSDFQFVPVVENTQPSDGLYRLRSRDAGRYLTLPADKATGKAMRLAATPSAENIFFVEGGRLLSYATGYYVQNAQHAALGNATAFTLSAHPAEPDCYALETGGSYLRGRSLGVELVTYNMDATTAWELVPVSTLPVSVSAAGYSTLYTPQTLAPAAGGGFQAYTARYDETAHAFRLDEVTEVLPARQGLVVKAPQGEYHLPVVGTTTTATSDLSGTLATTAATADLFTLQMGTEGIGFYRFANDNSGNTDGLLLKGFKAYWQAPTGFATAGLRFIFDEGDVTNLTGAPTQSATNAPIYDLAGRRVGNMQRGCYIVGRKIYLIRN